MANTTCSKCQDYSPGFLSEPDECDYFNEPYKWLIKFDRNNKRITEDRVPDWCPRKEGM